MKIIAHRGFSEEYPENTLLAFEKALELDVDGIETDLRLSLDGEAIIFHDKNLQRIAHVDKTPEALTLHELQSLNAGAGEKIPSLLELLKLVDAKTTLILEIKYNSETYKRLCKVIEEHINDKLEWVEVSCFDDRVLEQMHRLNKKIRLHKLIDKESTLKDKEFPMRYDYVDYFDIDIKLAKVVLEEGFIQRHKIIFWTVDKEDIKKEIQAGLYAIMTNNPKKAKEHYA